MTTTDTQADEQAHIDALLSGQRRWVTADPIIDPFDETASDIWWVERPPASVGDRIEVAPGVTATIVAVVPIAFGAVTSVNYPDTGAIDCRGYGDPATATATWHQGKFLDDGSDTFTDTDLSDQVWGNWAPGRFAYEITDPQRAASTGP